MLTILLLSLLIGQSPEPPKPVPLDPPIVFPDVVVPAPKPVNIDTPIAIKVDELYVVQSDIELFIRQSPKDRLAIEAEAGPIKVRGKFVGSTDKSKTFTKKFVYIVTIAEKAESGLSDLFFVPRGVQEDKAIIAKVIDAQRGPRPPPPNPDPPGPTPNPNPPAGTKFFFIIVQDRNQELTPEVGRVVGDLDYWQSLAAQGHQWKALSASDPIIAEKNLAKFVAKAGGAPCLIITDLTGKCWRSVPLPKSTEAVTQILKGLGG